MGTGGVGEQFPQRPKLIKILFVPNIQFIKSVAFSSLVADPWWRDRRGPEANISIRQLLWTEIITSEHACIFKHCSFKTTLVSHVFIKALVEIDKICMAGGVWGGGGVTSLLQKSNFCEPKKRANNFRNLTPFLSLWTNQVSPTIIDVMLIGCQTMISCFVFEHRRHAMLCAIFIPTSSIGYTP